MVTGSAPPGATGAPATVFVSYSRGDRERALPVIAALEAGGFSVWWDGRLQPGERFADTTAAALDSALAVVVLWSATSVASHWVHDEATRGRDRRVLVPLSLDGTAAPLGFGQFQTINIACAKPGDATFAQVLAAVAALHGAAPAAAGPAIVPRPPRVGRRTLLAGGAVAVVAAGSAAAWRTGVFGPAASANTVAVLPFANISGDAARDYFSDGLAAEVRAALARNPLLRVAGQTSSNQFRGQSEDSRSISRRLGVVFLLDGNVRYNDGRVRVVAELVNGQTGFSQWSRTFDRPASDVFAVQDEIAKTVTAALTRQMLGAAETSTPREVGGTSDLAAYDAFLKGRHLYGQAIGEATDRAALASFDAAVASDPGYALAHAARARVLTVIANQYSQGAERRANYRSAIEAAQRAVAIAPASADAQSALGFGIFNGRLNAAAARLPFERSAELGQGDGDILSRFAVYSMRSGDFAAARQASTRAVLLDPLNARTAWLAGEIEFGAHIYQAALAPVRRALALNPKLGVARSVEGAALFMLGDLAGAEKAYAAEPNTLFGLTGLAIVRQRQGQTSAAEAALEKLVADHGDNSLYQQAEIHASFGQTAKSLRTLDLAYEAGDAGVMYARNDPFLDPLRRTPEFARLLSRLGYS